MSRPDQRLEAGVGASATSTAQRLVGKSRGPGAALARVGEVAGEARSRMHLQQQLGQVEPRQPRVDGGAQRGQAGGSSILSSGPTERSGPPGVLTIATAGFPGTRAAVSR